MQAKERLTGAIILVVLIVLVVPELLTGPRRSAPPADAGSAQGPPMRSYTIELGEEGVARPAQPRPQLPIQTVPQPTAAAAEPVTESSAEEGEAPPASRAASGNTAPAPQALEPPARAAAAAPGKPAPPPVTGWSIQVGSFANADNARRLAADLRQKGYQSFIKEGTGGGRTFYRVRVGPAGDRASAQALAVRLKAEGSPGSIVPYP